MKLIDWKQYAMDFCGYELLTTFGNDFDIADAFGAGDAETLDAALRGARDFLKEHLLVWVPLLAERAGKTGTAPLYPQLLRILDSFLKQDRETLNDLLSEGVHAHD